MSPHFSKLIFVFLLIIIPSGPFIFIPKAFADTDIEAQEISTDTIWDRTGSPYHIKGQVTVDASTTFSIEPGTEIDFGSLGDLEIYASALIGSSSISDGIGEQDQAVIFSGSHSDQGDGRGCQSYNPINIYGQASSTILLSHFETKNGVELYLHNISAEVSHGKFDCGLVGLRIEKSQINVSNSTFTNFDDTALQIISSGVSITSSVFDGGAGIGVSSLGSNLVFDHSTTENFSSGMNIVATDATVTNSLFKQNATGAAISDRVFLSSLIDLPPLRKNFSNVYMNGNIFDTNYNAATTSRSIGTFLEQDDWSGDSSSSSGIQRPVVVIPGILGSALQDKAWVIDPVFHIYDNLLDTLRAAGYVDNVTLFPFGYDWHQSNEVTAVLLGNFLEKVRGICGCSTIDIVAHSMGGLVARQYIQSPEYNGDVGHMIFLGTPHLGSPSSYLMYAYDSFGDTLDDKVLTFMFGREAKANGYDSLSAYIQGLPIRSVNELLPIHPYLYDALGVLPYDAAHYVVNSFLEHLRDGVQYILERSDVLNILGESDDFTPSGFASYGYIPDQNTSGWTTISGIGATSDLGDGTVVWSDARSQLTTHSLIIDSAHTDLPTKAEALVVRTLTGSIPTVLVNNPFDPSYGLMIMQTLFPVHIFVIDPDGQYIGFNDQDSSSSDDDEDDDPTPAPTVPIDRAFYQETASSTLVAIPHPKKGKYTVIVSSKEKDPKKVKTIKKVVVDSTITSGKTVTAKRYVIPEIKPFKQKKIKIIIKYIKDPPTVNGTTTGTISTDDTATGTESQSDPDDDSNDEVIDEGQTDPLPIDDTIVPTPDDFSGDSDGNDMSQGTSTDATATTTTSVDTSSGTSTDTGSGTISTTTDTHILVNTSVPSITQEQSQSSHFSLAQTGFKSSSFSGGYHPTTTPTSTPTATILLLKIKLLTLEIQWYNRLMEILEKLFGGAAKVRIIKLFLFNPEALYTRADVISRTKSPIKDVKASIALLEKVKFLKSKMITTENKKRAEAWYLDQTFPYIGALQSLLINIMPLSSNDISKRLQKAGKMKLVVISGVFIQNVDSRVDLLVVGDGIKRGSLENAVKGLEADIGKELTYAYFDTDDYLYRLGMYDKLVRDILDFPHTVVVDKISA